ncbi:MAG: sn-glycerol-1-phosphate dehydrogenase [Lachnospiraceae bacterium]|jgi:glycerol-1-phosphate dehydrogenase [NAD(P)+]|nr:sn-glycerol-1-phosphate dehydrogenase [Lachnospiraceae bacterium]
MRIDSKKLNGPCSCGRDHTMNTRAAVIEPGVLADFERYLSEYGLSGTRCAVYDENTYHAKNLVRPRAGQEIVLNPEHLHADEAATGEVLRRLDADVKLLVAVGSGTIHDTTRYCAHKLGIPFVACPTAASVDGFCSTVSAMTWGGYKKTMPGVAPELVLADVDVIKEAPLYLALAGVGDILGKYTALADWKIAHALTGEFFCPTIEGMTRDAVRAVYECCEQVPKRDPKAMEQLTYGLLLSGLAMQLMGNSRPASGSEHHISHLIEMQPEKLAVRSSALHGEKVGVGTAIASGVYHRLAELTDISALVKPYVFPGEDELFEFYGSRLVPAVLEENKNNCMDGVTPEMLSKAWPKIREIISEIPTQGELLTLYERLGAKKSLSDIEVPEDRLELLLTYSPTVRNRMTLMRIKRMLTV